MKRIRIPRGTKVFIDGEEGIFILSETAWVDSRRMLPLVGPINEGEYDTRWVENNKVFIWDEDSQED
jgi:hypothetical protein